MKVTTAAASAAIVAVASAKHCQDITVPVTISAMQPHYEYAAPKNNIEVTNFILDLTEPSTNYPMALQKGMKEVKGTYKLATTFCQPDHGKTETVQLLTHGIGFDRSYWDLPYNNHNYSYSNVAVDHYGYSTFSWDRLGIAESQHGEPVNEIQALIEVAALAELTKMLRAGKITGCEKFKKVLHVGHSFGSEHTYRLTADNPGISDGIALTGFSQNGTYIPYFGLGGNFVEANTVDTLKQYPNGYLAAGDATGVQTNFFAPNSFDPEILPYAVKTGQPVTIGELLTIGSETAPINHFKGPALVITGERDLPYCGGNCNVPVPGYPNIPAGAAATFPDTKVKTVIVPGAGHGLNYDYTHPFTYKTINDFFVSSGVGPMPVKGGQKGHHGGGWREHRGGDREHHGGHWGKN